MCCKGDKQFFSPAFQRVSLIRPLSGFLEWRKDLGKEGGKEGGGGGGGT